MEMNIVKQLWASTLHYYFLKLKMKWITYLENWMPEVWLGIGVIGQKGQRKILRKSYTRLHRQVFIIF